MILEATQTGLETEANSCLSEARKSGLARADGSQQRKVEGIPLINYLLASRMPSFSPDGSSIAFFQPEAGPLGDFWVIPSTGGDARRLTFDLAAGRSSDLDSRWTVCCVLFSTCRQHDLWKVAAVGGTPEPVLMGAGEDTDPEFSRDGRKLLYAHTRSQLCPDDSESLNEEHSRTHRAQGSDLWLPTFSPSGDRISYFSHQNDGEIHLFTIQPDGTNLTQVTRGKGERNSMPHWSADGSSLYYYQSRPTQSFRKIRIGATESSLVVDGWRWDTQMGMHASMSHKNSSIHTDAKRHGSSHSDPPFGVR